MITRSSYFVRVIMVMLCLAAWAFSAPEIFGKKQRPTEKAPERWEEERLSEEEHSSSELVSKTDLFNDNCKEEEVGGQQRFYNREAVIPLNEFREIIAALSPSDKVIIQKNQERQFLIKAEEKDIREEEKNFSNDRVIQCLKETLAAEGECLPLPENFSISNGLITAGEVSDILKWNEEQQMQPGYSVRVNSRLAREKCYENDEKAITDFHALGITREEEAMRMSTNWNGVVE